MLQMFGNKWLRVLPVLLALGLLVMPHLLEWSSYRTLKLMRLEMKARLLNGDFQHRLEIREFSYRHWINLPKPEAHEFIFEGDFYDILSIRFKDGTVRVECVNDHKETVMRRAISRWMGAEDSPYKKMKSDTNFFGKILKFLLCPEYSSGSVLPESYPLVNEVLRFWSSRLVCSYLLKPPCSY